MRLKKYYLASVFLLVSLLLNSLIFQPSAKASFVASNVMDDSVFDNAGSMSGAAIDAFLNNNFPSSCISTNRGFAAPDPIGYSHSSSYTYGSDVSAGTIIFHAAQAYGLNPQYILATLQKEQSLVSGTAGCSTLRYVGAMGNGCPDGGSSYDYSGFELYSLNGQPVNGVSGTCVNTATAVGFSRQVITATWKLKFFQQHSLGNYDWAVVKPGWDNSDDIGVCYAGPMTEGFYKRGSASSCSQISFYDGFNPIDGSSIHMDTGATAASYYYTPHLHGNQLLVNTFESWFGPSSGDGYVLATSAMSNGDSRQWVIFHGQRHLVPDTTVLQAWGLNNVTLLQWDGAYLGSFADGQQISRLMRPPNTQDVYFVDNVKAYKITSVEMLNAWGFSPAAILDVTVYLAQLPVNSGNLSYAVKNASAGTDAYLVDSGTKRRYANVNISAAWEGDNAAYATISDAYFNAMGSASDITNTKVSAGAGQQEYQVVAGQKLPESSNVAQLYPGSAVPNISVATINRLITSAPASQFMRVSGSNTVYMVDSGSSHAVSSIEVLRAWGVGSSPLTNIVTQGNLNLLTAGSALNSFEADIGGQLYLMDGRRITIPAALDNAYRKTGNVYSASQPLLNLSPAGETATEFIKGFNTPAIYLMDNAVLRNIGSPNQLNLWNGAGAITSVSEYVLGQFGSPGSVVGAYVTDGSSNYVIEGGNKHLVSAAVASNWQLPSPATLSNTTIARLPSGAVLDNSLQASGQYFRVHKGTAFVTVDSNIADTWAVKTAPSMNSALVSEFLQKAMMTRFVKSAADTRLFIVDGGILYYLSPEHAGNLGMTVLQPTMTVDPSAPDMTTLTWSGVVVHNSGGTDYSHSFVIDQGGKRSFPSAPVVNYWTNNGIITTPQVTDGFLNLLPNKGIVDRAIKSSGPSVYAIYPEGNAISKHWITNPSIFTSNYGRYEQVTDQLLSVLPTGPNIN